MSDRNTPVGKYVYQLEDRKSVPIEWNHTGIMSSYTEALAMEKDGWQLPYAKDFKFLPGRDLPYAQRKLVRVYGYFWTRDRYQDMQPTVSSTGETIIPSPLYIGYNATFDYYVLRLESEKLQVSLIRYG